MIYTIKFFLIPALVYFLTICDMSGQDPNAEIKLKHTICKIENDRLVVENQLKIKVYNRKGEDNIHFSIPYNDKKELKNLSGFITDFSGNKVRKLSKKEIKDVSDVSDMSLFEDDYKKVFTLKHNQYPYIIHVNYTHIIKEYLNITQWTPVYNSKYLTRKGILEIYLPADRQYYIKEINISIKPKLEQIENQKHYTWEIDNTVNFKKEEYSPPIEAIIPKIIVSPEDFNYEIHGKQDSWKNFGQWIYNLSDGFLTLPASERHTIDTLIQNCENDKEKIKRLYYYLQDNTRYISVQLGIGGFRPFSATYVAEKKYGDCKALSNYMRAMLNYAGIESYYVNILADDNNSPFYMDFPSQQFNHAIVMIPMKQDSIWLECTSDYNPVGYVNEYIHNRQALIIANNNSKLTKTPALTPSDVMSTARYTFNLKTEGMDVVTINYKKKGSEFLFFSGLAKEADIDLQKEIIERMHYYFHDKEITDYSFYNESRDSASINLSLELNVNNQIKKYGNDLVCKVIDLLLPDFERPSKRKLPVWINYPKYSIDTIEYIIPERFKISTVPEDITISGLYGFYKLESKTTSDKVILIRSFQLNKGNYSLNEYPDIYSFIQKVKIAERKNIISLTK